MRRGAPLLGSHGGGGVRAPEIDPASFVAGVDRPLSPLVPDTAYTFLGPDEMIKVVVTTPAPAPSSSA